VGPYMFQSSRQRGSSLTSEVCGGLRLGTRFAGRSSLPSGFRGACAKSLALPGQFVGAARPRYLLRGRRRPTKGIRTRNGATRPCVRWNLSRGLVRGRTDFSLRIDRRHHIVVSCGVFHEIVHATGADDGCRVNLLAVIAPGVVLCGVLRLAPVQAVPGGSAIGSGRGSTCMPGECHFVVASFW
jgi:hypothetical protein